MTPSQKILIAVLGIIFVGFAVMFFGVNAYNEVADLDAKITTEWGNFEKAYQPRYELIQRLTQRAEQVLPNEEAYFQMKVQSVNYGQSRTVEARVSSLISLETNLTQLIRLSAENEKLRDDDPIVQLVTSLKTSEALLTDSHENYNGAVANYNQKLVSFPYSIISSYFGFTPKESLPRLWNL